MAHLYRAEREKQEKERQEQRQRLSCTRAVGNNAQRKELDVKLQTKKPLGRALASRADILEQSPVTAFLREHCLSQYAEVFLQHGFDDMDTLLDIEDEHLKDMGLPPGHILKLKRRIRELGSTVVPEADLALVTLAEPTRILKDMGSMSQPSTSQMTAVQLSWVQVKKLGSDVAGELFYKKFFKLRPEAKELFPLSVRLRYQDWANDTNEDEHDIDNSPALRKLWAKVIDALGSAVAGLQDVSKLVPMLHQLGMRHVGYGLKPEYFQVAGEILIDVLKEGLGDACTKEVENAWVMVFHFMSATMLQGFDSMQAELKASTRISSSRTLSEVATPNSSSSTGLFVAEDGCLRDNDCVATPLGKFPLLLSKLNAVQGQSS